MYPTLISFGPIQISTLSLLAVIGMILAAFMIWRRAHEEHYDDDEVFDVMLIATLVGWLTARIFHILFFYPEFGLDPWTWMALSTHPGLHEMSGIIMGLYMVWWLANRRKWNAWDVTDFMASGLTMWLIWIWVGRFFAGTFAGTVTNLPIGISVPNVFDKLHPVQVYFAILLLIQYIFLSWAEKRYRFFQWYRGNRHAANAGFITSCFLIGYGLSYLILSPFYIHQIVIAGIRWDLALSLVVAFSGAVLLYLRAGGSLIPKRRWFRR